MKHDFIEIYLNWLKENMFGKQIDDFYEITTPFLDRHNDCIQIYAKEENNNVFLTDDGYTLNDHMMCGIDLTDKRKKIIEKIVRGYGIQVSEEELFIHASLKDFAMRMNDLIQSILSINDIFLTSKSTVVSLFSEIVFDFLKQNKIKCSPNIEMQGDSGFTHKFDFMISGIPGEKNAPEIFMKAINNPTFDNSKSVIFQWQDTMKKRKEQMEKDLNSEMIVFLNDTERKVSSKIIEGYETYGITAVPWKKRDSIIPKLKIA